MSSTQQSAADLIQFGDRGEMVNQKEERNIVQKMVTGDSASATLIATAVAKLTSSALTTSAASPDKSESDRNESPEAPPAPATQPSAARDTVHQLPQVCTESEM